MKILFNKNSNQQLASISLNYGDPKSKNILDMISIRKEFLNGKIVANDDVDLSIKRGEIHALIGENGSGKSTLMSILFGIYEPTAGMIFFNDEKIKIKNPMIAKQLGIGMVHQHYQLVENMTCLENAILGQENSEFLNLKNASDKFNKLVEKYNFKIKAKDKVQDLTIGQKQKLEIVKVLWSKKQLIVFDEPTAALSLQEIEEFMKIIKQFKAEGKTVIFISHKLHEVKALADRLSILRKGKLIETIVNKNLNPNIISKKMIGELVVLNFKEKQKQKIKKEVYLEIKNVSTINKTQKIHDDAIALEKKIAKKMERQITKKDLEDTETMRKLSEKHFLTRTASWLEKLKETFNPEDLSMPLKNINLKIYKGEILGISGVADNGQTELLEVISGLRPIDKGEIIVTNKDITHMTIKKRNSILGHIPEDRHRYGMALDMNLYDNSVINIIDRNKFSKLSIEKLSDKLVKTFIKNHEVKEYADFDEINNFIKDQKAIELWTDKIIDNLEVQGADDKSTIARNLSGGNQQKFVVGREILQDYGVLVAGHPTRGLDVKAVKNIYKKIIQNANNKATIISSYELEELMAVCDRIAVIFNGQITTIVNPKEKNAITKIGKAMIGERV